MQVFLLFHTDNIWIRALFSWQIPIFTCIHVKIVNRDQTNLVSFKLFLFLKKLLNSVWSFILSSWQYSFSIPCDLMSLWYYDMVRFYIKNSYYTTKKVLNDEIFIKIIYQGYLAFRVWHCMRKISFSFFFLMSRLQTSLVFWFPVQIFNAVMNATAVD